MRVAFCMLRSEIGRRDGGAESIRNLIDGLRSRPGIEISLVTAFGSYPCHVSYAPYPWRDSKAIPLIRYFYRTVKKVSLEHDITVLVLPNAAFGYLADIIKLRVKKPIVVNYESQCHLLKNYRLAGDNLSWRNIGRLIAFNGIVARLSQKLCDKYIVSTQFQKNRLIEIGHDSVRIDAIPNCTNLATYSFQVGEKPWNRRRRSVMYLGHFNHSKGVDVLVDAMPSVLNEFPNAKLSLVWSGSGGEYPRVMRMISKRGLIDATEMATGIVNVPEYLSHAEVLVLPYRSLSMTRIIPSLLLEAFSIGVPLVVCDCDPIREIVNDHQTGIVTHVNDANDLARGITEFLENRDLRELVVQSQREVAKQQFSHTVVAERYERILTEMLNG
jgi:glycosyltransferase involved in cell wall biosynthesis